MEDVKLDLIRGDITERNTDAIVNASNNMLILGSGLGGAIKAKGGKSIVEECSKYGKIDVGEAVITRSGRLKTKYIIHAAVMEYDGTITEEGIGKSLLSSLRIANEKKLKSISIPDMSMGIIRFSPSRCAETMLEVIQRFLGDENVYLRLIEVVVWDIETLYIFKAKYKMVFKQD